MADDNDDSKTEDPTQKRLDDALKRGDVVKSQEVNTWFALGAATLILLIFARPMSRDLSASFRGLIGNVHDIPVDGRALVRLSERLGLEILAAMALPFLILMLAALLGNAIQHRWVWSSESLQPKLSKVSLLAGVKRLFSKHALINFAKGLAKLAIITAVMFAVLWPERYRLDSLVGTDPVGMVMWTETLTLQLFGAVVAALTIVAALDYLIHYRTWFNRQKMSVSELTEEFKQSEGDPHIKAKIRQMRQARMKKRMMSAVPDATVIVTNPTHYSIALKYERGMNAPICVAKGVDSLALKIREIANKHQIPIVENPPLARALHATVEVDEEIPADHYKAVAELISYVMRVNRGAQN